MILVHTLRGQCKIFRFNNTLLQKCTSPHLVFYKLILFSQYSYNPISNPYNCSFHINTEKSFGDMAEEMKAFPQLSATPPLLLKGLGYDQLHLVFLSKGTAKI